MKKSKYTLYSFTIIMLSILTVASCAKKQAAPMSKSQEAMMREPSDAPAWPLPFSEEDALPDENPREFEQGKQSGWSGGADLTPPGGMPPVTEGRVAPNESKMPLANKALGHDDGVSNLAASNPPVSGVKKKRYTYRKKTASGGPEEKKRPKLENQVRDWVAKEGYTLREVLEEWAALEGWKIVWSTNREYPLQAGVIFRGRFTDVASAIIRTFAVATPTPYAKFFFGNKTLVVKTLEDQHDV